MKLFGFLTRERSVREDERGMGKVARFSRVRALVGGGTLRVMRRDGFPSPNSRAGENVRTFLVHRIPGGGGLKDLALSLDREPKRIYHEAEGDVVLSWDFVDRAGAVLSLEDRLTLGRYLMDRWGLRAEAGRVPPLES